MTLAIALLGVFTVVAIRAIRAMGREAAVIKEFGRSAAVRYVSLLLPAGGAFFLVAVATKVPAILVVPIELMAIAGALFPMRRLRGALERSGTDRVRRAMDAATEVIGASIAGFAALLAQVVWQVLIVWGGLP